MYINWKLTLAGDGGMPGTDGGGGTLNGGCPGELIPDKKHPIVYLEMKAPLQQK